MGSSCRPTSFTGTRFTPRPAVLRRKCGLQPLQSDWRASHPSLHSGSSQQPNRSMLQRPDQLLVAGRDGEIQSAAGQGGQAISRRYQLTASYALQSSQSVLDVTQNLKNFFASYGPDLPHHNLTVSGIVDLPWKFQISLLSTVQSHPPIAPTINGFNNAGTDVSSSGYTPLLGVLGQGYSAFMSKDKLAGLVNLYNNTIARNADACWTSRDRRQSEVPDGRAPD